MGTVSLTDTPHPLLPGGHNYLKYQWTDGARSVWFSAARKGNGMTMHICAPNRTDKLALRVAGEDFVNYLFDTFDWLEVIFCISNIQATINQSIKQNFHFLGKITAETEQGTTENFVVTARYRDKRVVH